MPPAKLSIDVFKINGDAVTVSVDRQTTVQDLKNKLAELWNNPPECQKLLYGGELLEKGRYLSSLHKNKGAKLSVHYLISGEDIFICLENSNAPLTERLNSLRALTDIAHLDYTRALSILQASLLDDDFRVREIAVSGLIKVSHANDEDIAASVLRIACEGFRHTDDMVRTSSVELLGRVAPKCDTLAINELCDLATDPSFSVRCELLKAIPHMAPAPIGQAWQTVLTLSSDDDWMVREAAARTIGEVMHPENAVEALAALVRLTKDEERNVRIVAAQALSTCTRQ